MLSRLFIAILGVFCSFVAVAQNLTISSSSSSGSYSVSGTNPITFTANGTANISTSDIQTQLNAGNSVIVRSTAGTITQSAAIEKSSGSSASLTYKAEGSTDGSITVSSHISSTSNALNLVFWSNFTSTAGTGVSLSNINISTNGGHFYIGGGAASETANGLTVPTDYTNSTTNTSNGIGINTCTINTNGGSIRMKGSVSAVDGVNAGVHLYGTTSLSSGAGALSLFGRRTGDPFASAGLFLGTNINVSSATGNVSLSSTSGAIYLEGKSANTTNSYGWNHALAIVEYAGDDVTITSTTGDITLNGDATNAAGFSGEALGFVIQSNDPTGLTQIATDGGNITIIGKSSNAVNNFGAAFRSGNAVGNIAIGDGNSGNITLRFGSLSINSHATTGRISLQGVGSCVLEGIDGGAFASAIDLTTAYSFGATLASFRVGNASNNQNLTLNAATSIAGDIDIYAGTITLNNHLTATNGGDITFYSNNAIAGLTSQRNITAAGLFSYIPQGASFGAAVSFPITNLNVSSAGLIVGKTTNTADITVAGSTTISGPVTLYGGNINLDQNINTSGAAASGDILCKASGDIVLAASKSLTTAGADVILWANSDNGNSAGSVALKNSSAIVTGSNSVTGGHVWIGGGSNGGTWNGLAVGTGYAVPGTNFTPSNGGSDLQAGVYLEKCSISSFGGAVKILGNVASTGRAITTYGTINIDAKAGEIEIEGNATNSAITNAYGILFGIHDISIASLVNLTSSASGTAITVRGFSRGTEDAIGLSGTLNAQSTGAGDILFNGTAYGSGQAIVIGNYYHGKLNAYAATGDITFNGGSKGIYVSAAVNTSGLTQGPSKLNIGQGGNISSSSSNVILTGDVISSAASGIAVISTGNVTIQPSGNSFTSAVTFSSPAFALSSTVAGLTIGKVGNTADITINAAQTVAGPITIYGRDIDVNQNLTSSLSGAAILLQATGAINLAASKVIQTNAGDVTLNACSGGVATSASSAIYLYSGSQILTSGGDITLGGAFAGTEGNLYAATNISGGGYAVRLLSATLSAAGGDIRIYGRNVTSYGDGVFLSAVTINTTGAGTIGIYGDSFGGHTPATSNTPITFFGGITFNTNASLIQTVNGNLTLEGILTQSQSSNGFGINFYRQTGDAGLTNHIQLLSQSGDINITGDAGTTIGGGIGSSSWGNIYIGSPANSSFTATGDIKLMYSRFVGAGLNGMLVKTTGNVTYEPTGTSFTAAQTFPNNNYYMLADGAASLTIGKAGNTADITISSAQSVAGDLTIYGGTITLSGNLTTTNNGDISLYSNNALGGLTSPRTITTAGLFSYIPQGNSFASGLTYPITNLSLTATGLLLGKPTNTAALTFNATSINGPITLYGGALTLNGALATTNTTTGNMSLNGTTLSGGSLSVANGRTLTMNLSSTTTYTGTISGSDLNVVKDGAGILTLTGSSTPNFATLTISGGTYSLNANQQLTLSGALTNNGIFTLKDGATFVPGTSGTSVLGTGTFNVEKQLTGNATTWDSPNNVGRFWYMGVPMNSVARSSFGTQGSTSNRVWSYSEATKQYTEISSSSTPLTGGTGYVHRRNDNNLFTFSATGTDGLRGTDFTLSGLTRTSGSSVGFNLVANPYMAYLDWDAITKTNVEETYYIRSHNSNSNDISALITFNGSSNVLTNNSSLTLSAAQMNYIAPLQAIWVRVGPNSGTGSLTMTRSMLSHQTGNPGLKTSTIFPTLARVNLLDGARFDQMLVYLNQDMSNAVDQYDSEKMFVSGAPQLYTMASGKKLVMNGLNSNKKKISVPLYLELPTSKVYELQLSEYLLEDGLILLEDKQEGTIQDFTNNDTYAFYGNSGVLQNRFVLHFYMPDATITAQGPSNSWVEQETSYTEGGNVQITADSKGKVQISLDQAETDKAEGTVQATDANGRVVYSGALEGQVTMLELNVPSGVYYLTVQSGNMIEKKKVFIQD